MTLSQIVVLLQAVLALLSNPNVASNAQAQALAQQAVLVATQALENNTSTMGTAVPIAPETYTVPATPTATVEIPAQPATTVTYSPQPQPANDAAEPSFAAAPTPSCSVSLDLRNPPNAFISWDSSNTTGVIPIIKWRMVHEPDGFTPSWSFIDNTMLMQSYCPHGDCEGNPPLPSNATTVDGLNLVPHINPELTSAYPIMQLELQIGGAVCTTTVHQ